MKRLLAALLAALTFTATPAYGVTAEPEVVWRLPSAPDGRTYVQIEGPPRIWGMRKVARYVDTQLEDLRIFTRGECADRPRAVCVRVQVRRYEDVDWWGQATVGRTPVRVWLNRSYSRNRGVACHEFLHALGLDHHEGYGCLTELLDVPSDTELAALRAAY